MLRSLIAFGLVSLAGTAHADDVIGDTGATLGWPEVDIRPNFSPDAELREPEDGEEFRQHLNLAACTCSKVSTDVDTKLYYQLTLDRPTNKSLPVEVAVGANCEDDINFEQNCRVIDGAGIGDVDSIINAPGDTFIEVPLFALINPKPGEEKEACNQFDGGTANVWAILDSDQNGDRDVFSSRPIDLSNLMKYTDVAGFDTKPPPLPEDIRARGGEGSIELTWSIPASNALDLYAYQAFCVDLDDAAVGSGATPLYSTTETICGIPAPQDLVATAVDSSDGTPVTAPPSSFTNLDSAFICGTQESATATSLSIQGLTNGQEYKIALVAIDFYGNPTGTFLDRTVIPQPVTDFWEDIHDRGGKIEGGFCSTNGGETLPGLLVPLAFVWLIRRRKKVAPMLMLGGLFAAPSIVRADDFTPYWEDPATTTEDGGGVYEDEVKWRAGIKLGPYTPAIDDQLGANMTTGLGPYAAMFGNFYTDDNGDGVPEGHDKHVYQFLPMLDVDRVLWSGSGQFAVGGSLGYMQKTAFAYQDGTSADEIFRLRSRAGSNTFRLIPFALTASYRATQLDDLWGIPVVPYLRGGLAYYIWWMKGPSGSLSKICTDGTEDSDCEANKAYGGSLGFQGSLGLSIRAERIDRDAARSMKQSGIYHAGFYVELMAAIVNGFGSDKKLSVGDKTWFAGFDFEF